MPYIDGQWVHPSQVGKGGDVSRRPGGVYAPAAPASDSSGGGGGQPQAQAPQAAPSAASASLAQPAATTAVPGGSVNLTATPDSQLEALRSKKEDYTSQLQANATKESNVARLGTADSFEGAKSAAMQAAREAGRPWTNADEAQWAARKNKTMTQQQNALTLGREKTVAESLGAQDTTINSQISQQLQQKQQQLDAARMAGDISQREADRMAQQAQADAQNKIQQMQMASAQRENEASRVAQQAYQQAQLQLEQQRMAQQQSQQLQSLMYGQVNNAQASVAQNVPGAVPLGSHPNASQMTAAERARAAGGSASYSQSAGRGLR